MLPIKLIILFNIFTLFIFITSPYEWNGSNVYLVTAYLGINYLAIYLGYSLGLKNNRPKYNPSFLFKNNRKIVRFIYLFYFFTFLIKYAYLLRFEIIDISGMFKYLLIGIYDPMMGYKLSVNDIRPHTISWLLFTLVSTINQIFFITGFIFWKKVKRFH